jgi:hypothetical protein
LQVAKTISSRTLRTSPTNCVFTKRVVVIGRQRVVFGR